MKEWQELLKLTGGEEIVIERIRIVRDNIAIEGEFELPAMARLSLEDQVFIAAFIKTHGSIKQMEQIFGISYPTVKNRLNRLGEKLDFVKVENTPRRSEILAELERGEITVEEAIERMKE